MAVRGVSVMPRVAAMQQLTQRQEQDFVQMMSSERCWKIVRRVPQRREQHTTALIRLDVEMSE
jgi:hypothetical protein